MSEFSTKQQLIQALLEERQLDALLLRRVSSFAWAACGAASYINTAAAEGAGSLLILPLRPAAKGDAAQRRLLLTTNIEAPRFEMEEKMAVQGWEIHPTPWYETDTTVATMTNGLRLGSDTPYPGAVDLSNEIARLRSILLPEEIDRFRSLGSLCSQAMQAAIRAVRPGQSEYEIAGRLALEAEQRGVQAIVNLIATDERIFNFRHPLPTAKKLDRYAMLVLCGRRQGLVCSITRLVHFGALPDELRRKQAAVARIDAAFIAATRPGATLGQIFARAQAVYAETGYADEWQRHHQGGPAGYEPREVIAVPGLPDQVAAGQTYAWNPSITGTKSEDTILIGEQDNEVLSAIPGWPTLQVEIDGKVYARPAILEG